MGGGGILKLSDLDSDNFHWRGYSETLGFGISDNFFWRGYSETLGFGLSDNFFFDFLNIFIALKYRLLLYLFKRHYFLTGEVNFIC